MDIASTLQPNSEQLDAIELIGAPRIFEIARVTEGSAEQPVNIHFTDFPRPWRPSKNMRRVLAACWGTNAKHWVGRRVELFFDPEVTFGKDKPGGTRISRLSDIPKRKSIPLLVSRGKSQMFTVEPLPNDVPAVADRADAAVKAFAARGVTQAQMEEHVRAARKDWTERHFTELAAWLRRGEEPHPPVPAQPADPADEPALPLDGTE